MSDQSSDSSCEWILLNENDDSLEDVETQPLNLQINYGAVCQAVSDSIKSSLSCEELEWEYDPVEGESDLLSDDLLQADKPDFYDDESHDIYVNKIEDIDVNSCAISNEYEGINISTVNKIRCYKHNRNDHVNFILNMLLALVISSAIGLGTGHFLGWSHKCQKDVPESKEGVHNLSNEEVMKQLQNIESFKMKNDPVLNATFPPEYLPDIFSLESGTGDGSKYQEDCKALRGNIVMDVKKSLSNNIITDTSFSDGPVQNTNTLELLIHNKVKQNSTLEQPLISNITTEVNFDKISHAMIPLKNINRHLQDLEETSLEVVDENLTVQIKDNESQFDLLKQFSVKNKYSNENSNLTHQLHEDLGQIIQTLNAIAVTRISSDVQKYSGSSVEDLRVITRLFSDFLSSINIKISYIDGYIQSTEYKKYSKFRVKHLQRIVYSLVDSVDHLMKISIKTFGKNNKKINSFKFSKGLSNIIFNFEKRWEKVQRIWLENIEKFKAKELKERSFKRETKQWKRKGQFEKYSNTLKRYSMKL